MYFSTIFQRARCTEITEIHSQSAGIFNMYKHVHMLPLENLIMWIRILKGIYMKVDKDTSVKVAEKQLISVVVPVYNVCDYLVDCLNSLLTQTYGNIEIVLVDDGSTDGSGAVCDEVALVDKRIKVVHQENGGLSVARNIGTKHTRGDWIVYVDSDDVVSPHYIEHLYAAAKQNCSDIAICKGTVFSENETFKVAELNRITVVDPDTAINELLSENRASTAAWGKLAKSSIWKSLPFPEGRKFEDMPITWKALYASRSVAILGGNYYGYRNRKTSISSSPKLDSIEDYATSIQQIWNELRPSSSQQFEAKCFRCCLEYCRLLEMLDRLTNNVELNNYEIEKIPGLRDYSSAFLRKHYKKAIRNGLAPISQRLRIAVTAMVPSVAIKIRKVL